jgi:hypothetical protein
MARRKEPGREMQSWRHAAADQRHTPHVRLWGRRVLLPTLHHISAFGFRGTTIMCCTHAVPVDVEWAACIPYGMYVSDFDVGRQGRQSTSMNHSHIQSQQDLLTTQILSSLLCTAA